MGRPAHASSGWSSCFLAPIYFIASGLPTPTFSERSGSAGWEHSWGGQRELHPRASLEHLGLRATLLGGGGMWGEDTSFTSPAAGSCAPPPRPPPKSFKIKGCSVLLGKQVRSRAPGSRGGRCQDPPGVVGARAAERGKAAARVCVCRASYCFCHRLARCRGARARRQPPLITPRAPIL